MKSIPVNQSAAKHRPDWRWIACRHGLHGPEYDSDPILQAMRKFYADLTDFSIKERTLLSRHPDIAVAYVCFCHDHRYGLRWLLEMWLVAGFSNSQIVAELENMVPESSISAFRLMFFDIDEHRSDTDYMERFVFEHAKFRNEASSGSIEYEYYWKKFADDLDFLKATNGLSGHISNAVRDWRSSPEKVKLRLFRRGTDLSNGFI